MAKIFFIEDGLISALQEYFGWKWVDDDPCPYLIDKDGTEVSYDDFDFCPIDDTFVEAENTAWEINDKKMICDGVLFFGDGCVEFHDKIGQDAYHWDCFTDESVLKIENEGICDVIDKTGTHFWK